MNLRFLIILITLFNLIIGCQKNHHVINVKATNIVTDEPYEGLKISVVQQTPGVFESKYKNVYEGFLDANGETTFDLIMKNNKSYQLGIELPENTEYFNDLYFSLKHDQEIQNVTVDFAPKAYLKFRYFNSSCFDSDDSIRVERISQVDDYVGFIYPAIYYGCEDYTMDNYAEVVMGWWHFEWSVTKNGTTNYFSDSIYLNEGECKFYEFIY